LRTFGSFTPLFLFPGPFFLWTGLAVGAPDYFPAFGTNISLAHVTPPVDKVAISVTVHGCQFDGWRKDVFAQDTRRHLCGFTNYLEEYEERKPSGLEPDN